MCPHIPEPRELQLVTPSGKKELPHWFPNPVSVMATWTAPAGPLGAGNPLVSAFGCLALKEYCCLYQKNEEEDTPDSQTRHTDQQKLGSTPGTKGIG